MTELENIQEYLVKLGSIKIFGQLKYNETEALNWAMEKKICLMLDKKAFEKVADSLDIPFVTREEIPKAMIKRKE